MPGNPLKDEDLRRLRALAFIEGRIRGKSIAQLAQEFNVSDDTVSRTLSWAKKAELVVQAEDRILQTLLPAAEKAITEVLAGINDEVKAKTAIRIFESALPAFGKSGKSTNAPTGNSDTDLASYISSIRDRAALTDNTIDGELAAGTGGIEGHSQLALPAAAQSLASQGISVPLEGDESPAEPARSAVDSEGISNGADSDVEGV